MTDLHFPWLEVSVLCPLLGGFWVARMQDWHDARKLSIFVSALTLFCAVGAWFDFQLLNTIEAEDAWHLLPTLIGRDFEILVIDKLSAPLLPLVALLFFLTTLATVRSKIRRFSFSLSLFSEAIVLATYSCKIPWVVIVLLALGTVPPYLEMRSRGQPTRMYALHMGLFVTLLVIGQYFVDHDHGGRIHALWAITPLLLAVLVRSGIVPFHCWMPDLFERATFGAALLFVTPMVGAYAALRLVLPIAPEWVLQGIGVMSLATALYAAGMALIQREARRFFCYLFLSHSALVLVGLEMVSPNGLTGGLCVWLSVGLAQAGLGLTLRALEARRGHLTMQDFQGLYEHAPNLATCFGLTGLASVGFPGTFGFVGSELLVDGAVETYPHVGIAVVVAAALNGIAIVQAYFLLFTGRRYVSTVSLQIRARERYSVLVLAALILIGGFLPQPIVASRYEAAEELLHEREEAKRDTMARVLQSQIPPECVTPRGASRTTLPRTK